MVDLKNNKMGTKKMELEAIRLSNKADKNRGVRKIREGGSQMNSSRRTG